MFHVLTMVPNADNRRNFGGPGDDTFEGYDSSSEQWIRVQP
jgi:hypothetical protein